MSKFNFAAFRNAWLDQVAADNTLSPMAFKLAWHLMKDCGRTFSKQGAMFSFRSQDGYAELLGIKTRHVRDLFTAMRDRGHMVIKRAGKGNPNRTYPALFDRQNNADQEDLLTGTIDPFDRHSDVIMTGTIVPGNLIEDISEEIQGRPSRPSPASSSSSTINKAPRSTIKGSCKGDDRALLASPAPRSDDSFNHEPWNQDGDDGPVDYDGPENEDELERIP
ncbi:MAG: hypothetical protein E5Y10_06930 [Mesorhizobium sp.]|nr:MAG: hypothetical protein E5Y10_06930 [Mesorhizobium sp.]